MTTLPLHQKLAKNIDVINNDVNINFLEKNFKIIYLEAVMETRFTFGGDEHLLCECSENMSFEAFFKAINSVRMIREANMGILEVCGGNAAYLVKFDPDLIHPDSLLETERFREESV